ncbi:hypothetical protein ALC57_14512, partial [Trachymyrmex cornetzi]
IFPAQLPDTGSTDISYSPTLTDTQPLDLTIHPPLDPGVQEILDYSPPTIEERFPPISLDQLPTPPPSFDQLPTAPLLDHLLPPSPIQPDPEPINWDRLFRLYSSPSNKGDKFISVYIPGNSSPFLVQYRHLIPICSWITFLASRSQ